MPWGSKMWSNYSAGVVGKTGAGFAHSIGQKLGGFGVAERMGIMGAASGATAGAVMGGTYGLFSDNTSFVGGLLGGATLGAGIGGGAGYFFGPGLEKGLTDYFKAEAKAAASSTLVGGSALASNSAAAGSRIYTGVKEKFAGPVARRASLAKAKANRYRRR